MSLSLSTGQPLNQVFLLQKILPYLGGLYDEINPSEIVRQTLERAVDKISEDELDTLMASIAANLVNHHPDYSVLGARLLMNRIYRQVGLPKCTFLENVERIYNHKVNGFKSTRVSQEVFTFIQENAEALEEIIDYQQDFQDYDYAAVMSFTKRGLETINGVIAETPSQMFLRVACGLNVYATRSEFELDIFERTNGFRPIPDRLKNMSNSQRLEEIAKYYQLLSKRLLSLPGPILMHAGSSKNQMASCFLVDVTDSLTEEEYPITGKVGGIMKALTQLAKQSQGGAGTAVAFHDIRGSQSQIRSSNGKSNGILPFMKMFDSTIGAVNQSGKRAGVCTIYLEPWHIDILDFLDAANHFTIEEKRCKNLFYALWMNDLFFERMLEQKGGAIWTLFDPAEVLRYLDKPLSNYYGSEFKEKYLYLESLKIGKEIPLMEIWNRVCELFQTAGVPYLVNKDQMNLKSNQQNMGVIKSSNVCTEIALVANENETGVCVLSSLCVSRYLDKNQEDGVDYKKIIEVSRIATRHLNNVIDLQYYPTPETRNSCLKSRAIGISLQGLADVFHQLKLEYVEEKAKQINSRIYEAIYFGCMLESMLLAKKEQPYSAFEGSPLSKGILQFDMWNVDQSSLFLSKKTFNEAAKDFGLESLFNEEGLPSLSNLNRSSDVDNSSNFNPEQNLWDWLRSQIMQHGVRNSEVTAQAPTAASSIRMGNNEMYEPYTRNVFVRQHIGGSVQVVNPHLVRELVELNLWNQEVFDAIIYKEGSVQGINQIPAEIQNRYKTIYEIDWKQMLDMMADRAIFLSQTGSYNHYTSYQESGPTAFTQKIIYAWRKKLKTLSYYMHTETASTAKKELGGNSFAIPTSPSKPGLNLTDPSSTELNLSDNLSSGFNKGFSSNPNNTENGLETMKVLADGSFCEMKEGCVECSS